MAGSRKQEPLDIHEMERRIAQAIVDLVDDAATQHRITLALLAARTKLSARRIREVTDEWNLQTLSGDEYWFALGMLDRIREVANKPDSAPPASRNDDV